MLQVTVDDRWPNARQVGRIAEIIASALEAVPVVPIASIGDVYEADRKARKLAEESVSF